MPAGKYLNLRDHNRQPHPPDNLHLRNNGHPSSNNRPKKNHLKNRQLHPLNLSDNFLSNQLAIMFGNISIRAILSRTPIDSVKS